MHRTATIPHVLSVLTLALAGCGDGTIDEVPRTPTWYADVAPIAAARCAQCHGADGIAAFLPIMDPDTAVAWRAPIAMKVENREMPPFLADETPECAVPWGFVHDQRLSDHEIATIAAWAEADGPLGDPATAAPLVFAEVRHLDRVDADLVPRVPHETVTASEIEDEFVCLVLDPALDGTAWIQAIEVVPGDTEVVHHVVLGRLPRAVAEAEDLADGVDDDKYGCFSGSSASSGTLIGGWVPGSVPMTYPTGAGLPFGSDDVVIAEVHYHNAANRRIDASRVQLQWTRTAPEREVVLQLVGNAGTSGDGLQAGPNDLGAAEFRIPAGASGHTETSRHALDIPEGVEVGVFTVLPHMHLLGSSLRAWIEHEDGSAGPCLIHTPTWDFDWQLFYFYDATSGASPVLRHGDQLVIECTYDNALAVDVRLGEGSLAEMCIVGVGVVPL